MKYLQTIAAAYGYTIQRGYADGYSGYHILNRHHMSVGMFYDSLDSVAEYFADRIRRETTT
tara:strand:+ start:110 stop:292 length:183 start_codon:yes stop_codon:yes gene_type:complete